MLRKLFWDDPYRTQLMTRIAAVDGSSVMLEETILFAFSGGQESDAGTIAGRPVLGAAKSGFDVVYTVSAEHGLRSGDAVEVHIDWPRRYALMRLHSAAEIVLHLVYQLVPGVEKIGAHISPDRARLDFALNFNIGNFFEEIQASFATLVTENRPIVTGFSDAPQQRRFWEIEGFARVPCGGTHPGETGEIGQVALRRKNVGKGKERIEVTLVAPR